MKIPFNKSPKTERMLPYIQQVLDERVSGDGPFTQKCVQWFQQRFSAPHVLLTTSASHALDMSAYLADIRPDDEVIMASFTFSSSANAFVALGAKIVFVDIRPDTMNIDEHLIEKAITPRTKAIVPMHYAGVSCNMDAICALAKKHNLVVIEDAAQGVLSFYKGKPLGTIGDFGCYSFHETKNYSMGEGGALLLQDIENYERAEILREKGTDRSKFFRGQVDKYSWVDWGSSYLPSELNAAYLWSQLEIADQINENRLEIWKYYYVALKPLCKKKVLELPVVPDDCTHNAHMFYIKVKNLEERTNLLKYLNDKGIGAVYHYVPLHSAPAGLKFGRFNGEDHYTTRESERLLRLPLFYQMSWAQIDYIVKALYNYYR